MNGNIWNILEWNYCYYHLLFNKVAQESFHCNCCLTCISFKSSLSNNIIITAYYAFHTCHLCGYQCKKQKQEKTRKAYQSYLDFFIVVCFVFFAVTRQQGEVWYQIDTIGVSTRKSLNLSIFPLKGQRLSVLKILWLQKLENKAM